MTTFKMPEPFATWHETDDDAGAWARPSQPVYTADQLKQALRDVLEQAAKLADGTHPHDFAFIGGAIRSMKEQIK